MLFRNALADTCADADDDDLDDLVKYIAGAGTAASGRGRHARRGEHRRAGSGSGSEASNTGQSSHASEDRTARSSADGSPGARPSRRRGPPTPAENDGSGEFDSVSVGSDDEALAADRFERHMDELAAELRVSNSGTHADPQTQTLAARAPGATASDSGGPAAFSLFPTDDSRSLFFEFDVEGGYARHTAASDAGEGGPVGSQWEQDRDLRWMQLTGMFLDEDAADGSLSASTATASTTVLEPRARRAEPATVGPFSTAPTRSPAARAGDGSAAGLFTVAATATTAAPPPLQPFAGVRFVPYPSAEYFAEHRVPMERPAGAEPEMGALHGPPLFVEDSSAAVGGGGESPVVAGPSPEAAGAAPAHTGMKLFLGGLRFELIQAGRHVVSWLFRAACGVDLAPGSILIHRRSKAGGHGGPHPTAAAGKGAVAPTGCASIFMSNDADLAALLSLNQRVFCASTGIYVADTADRMRELLSTAPHAILDIVDGRVRGPTHPVVVERANGNSGGSHGHHRRGRGTGTAVDGAYRSAARVGSGPASGRSLRGSDSGFSARGVSVGVGAGANHSRSNSNSELMLLPPPPPYAASLASSTQSGSSVGTPRALLTPLAIPYTCSPSTLGPGTGGGRVLPSTPSLPSSLQQQQQQQQQASHPARVMLPMPMHGSAAGVTVGGLSPAAAAAAAAAGGGASLVEADHISSSSSLGTHSSHTGSGYGVGVSALATGYVLMPSSSASMVPPPAPTLLRPSAAPVMAESHLTFHSYPGDAAVREAYRSSSLGAALDSFALSARTPAAFLSGLPAEATTEYVSWMLSLLGVQASPAHVQLLGSGRAGGGVGGLGGPVDLFAAMAACKMGAMAVLRTEEQLALALTFRYRVLPTRRGAWVGKSPANIASLMAEDASVADCTPLHIVRRATAAPAAGGWSALPPPPSAQTAPPPMGLYGQRMAGLPPPPYAPPGQPRPPPGAKASNWGVGPGPRS